MIFFRIGCFALILTGLLHLVGHFSDRPPKNETEKQLSELMHNYQIDVGNGETITMEGIQKGFSLCFSVLFLWTGVFGLILVKQFKENTAALQKVAIINTIALATCLGIGLIYFFIIPNACIALCLVAFVIASIRLK